MTASHWTAVEKLVHVRMVAHVWMATATACLDTAALTVRVRTCTSARDDGWPLKYLPFTYLRHIHNYCISYSKCDTLFCLQFHCVMTTTSTVTVTAIASFAATVSRTACVVTAAGRTPSTHLLRVTARWRRALTSRRFATMAEAAREFVSSVCLSVVRASCV